MLDSVDTGQLLQQLFLRRVGMLCAAASDRNAQRYFCCFCTSIRSESNLDFLAMAGDPRYIYQNFVNPATGLIPQHLNPGINYNAFNPHAFSGSAVNPHAFTSGGINPHAFSSGGVNPHAFSGGVNSNSFNTSGGARGR
jgi:hypothetical protein